jgi:NAD(P)H-dependent FMN reductase
MPDPTQAQAKAQAQDQPRDLHGDRIAVVIGSTRPGRICPGIAGWVRAAAQEDSPLAYELLDLAAVNLPLLDEPLKPALGRYEHEHTREWSRIVRGYRGFVFVFPQYNWGYPAALKNALDFLYAEWHGKPAAVVSYGHHGGNKGAAQLVGVLHGLHMRPLDRPAELVVTDADLDGDWQLKDVDATLARYRDQVRTLNEQLQAALKDPSPAP